MNSTTEDPDNMPGSEVTDLKFEEIRKGLREVIKRLDQQNGFKSEAGQWIAGANITLEQIKDRQDTADELLVAHQTYIDQRSSDARELAIVKADVAGIQKDVDSLKLKDAGNEGKRRLVIDCMVVMTMLGTVALAIIELAKHG